MKLSHLFLLLFSCLFSQLYSQSFLNGNFELNTAGIDQINLTNVEFNSMMPNCNAFGTNGNMDIIASSYSGGPQSGEWYVALTGNGTDAIALQLNTPLVSGNSYTFIFYDKKYTGFSAFPIEIGLSTTNNNFGTLIYTTPSAAINSIWTQRVVSFVAPNNGQYITVKQQGSQGNWVQIDNFDFDNCGINLNLGNEINLCEGETLTLNASTPNASYQWQDNSINSTYTVSQQGTYWVNVTTNDCTETDTVTINYHPIPIVNLGNDTTLCQGETIVLDATIPNASYLWQNNSINSIYTVSQQEIYWVNVTANNCSVIDSITINYHPIADLGNDTTLCQGETIVLDATIPNASYLWQDNSINSTYIVSQQGTYWVNVATNDCNVTDSVTINYNPIPIIDLGNDTTLCQGETIVLDATLPNASYLWQDNSINSTYTVSQQGTYWVNVTTNNCTVTDSFTINYNQTPIIDLGNDTTLCQGETIVLDVTTPNASYLWQDNSINSTYIVSQQGTYWVNVANNNCTVTDSVTINYNPLPIIDLGNDTTLCQGETIVLDATIPNASYLWQNNSLNPTYTVSQQGTYWLEINISNCTSTDTININYNPLPNINLGNDTTLCQGETIVLDATLPNASYLWQDNSINSTYTVSQQGTYWVNVANNDCTVTDSVTINYNPLPIIDLGNDTTLCQSETIVLDATVPNASYLWQNNSMNPTYTVSQQGTYWLEININNCTSIDTININYNPLPSINLGNDTILCQGETIVLDATTPNASYLWQNNSMNPTCTVTQQGVYWVEVTANNCQWSDTITFEIQECEIILEMPNVFSPNNDGKNEYFCPKEMIGIEKGTLRIFNRWGQEILVTNNLLIGWDGTYHGENCSEGTYFWFVQYTSITNETKTVDGFLTLIR